MSTDRQEKMVEAAPAAFAHEFLAGMSRAASSVCIVTTEGPNGRAGITVSSVTSVSAEPPAILVCVRQQSSVASEIRENGAFCISMLNEDQAKISDVFAGQHKGEADRFSFAEWNEHETDCPSLAGAVAVFDCDLAECNVFGTHYIFIGTVKRVHVNEGGASLVYHDRRYCRVFHDQSSV